MFNLQDKRIHVCWQWLLTNLVAPKGAVCLWRQRRLTAKSVQSTSLTFERVHNVHGCHGLALGVLGVRNCITDYVLKENFENTTSLLVDQARDSLDTATTSKTTDGWLGDALDVIPKDFSVTLGASFSETFASFASTRHVDCYSMRWVIPVQSSFLWFYMGKNDLSESTTSLFSYWLEKTTESRSKLILLTYLCIQLHSKHVWACFAKEKISFHWKMFDLNFKANFH